jgi:hypothetical protein
LLQASFVAASISYWPWPRDLCGDDLF